jgi:TPR repeat protein
VRSLAASGLAVAFLACSGTGLDAPAQAGAVPAAEPAGQCIVAEKILADPPGSFEQGLAAWVGEGVPRDAARARVLLATACDDGSAPAACTVLGLMVETGEGGPKASGQELLERGGQSIYDLGGCEMAAPQRVRGITTLSTACCRAMRSCATGCDAACARAATHIRQTTLAVIERGCDRGIALACHLAAVSYAYGASYEPIGTIVVGDPDRATRLFLRACDGGIARACGDAGRLLMPMHVDGFPPGDAVRAAALLGKACDLGDGSACADLASARDAGEDVPKDHAEAMRLYERACLLGMTLVCNDLHPKASKE